MAATWSEAGVVGQRPTCLNCLSYSENARICQGNTIYLYVHLIIVSIYDVYTVNIYILISSAFILITSLTSLDWFLDGLAPKVTLASRNDWGWKPSGNTPKCTVVSISQWWVRCELDVFLSTEDNWMLRFVTLFALHLWQISEFPTNKASIAIAGTNCLEYLVANRSSPPSILKSYSWCAKPYLNQFRWFKHLMLKPKGYLFQDISRLFQSVSSDAPADLGSAQRHAQCHTLAGTTGREGLRRMKPERLRSRWLWVCEGIQTYI